MAWIDTTYVANAITSTVQTVVAPTGDVFDQLEAQARARVKEAASVAGYSLPDTTSSAQLKDLCLGVFIVLAYAQRKGLRVPEQYRDTFYRLDMIANGKAKLVDYVPSSRDGIGGSSFSATSGTNSRPQQFSRGKLSQW